ncbi:hypothetical protein AAHB33_15840 [Paenarthrobacter sp. S56]|uniref:hypothetical protein n=1 Tax=Paenarthrobacter sp. S56 TaxID=3138179 RepID=UPI00321BAC59
MEKPSLITPVLPSVPFTIHEAKAAGLQQPQLWRRKDIDPVSRGLYRPAEWTFDLSSAARALSSVTPGAWISHVTAARLHGLFLPPMVGRLE